MGVLNGGLAAVFGSAFGAIYLDGTVHTLATERVSGGALVEAAGANPPCKYQPERITQAMRDNPQFTDKDARYFILTAGPSPIPTLERDWEFTTAEGRWQILDFSRDPAGTYWDVHATPARSG